MDRAEVIGSPVHHSKSPAIHDFWLKALGRRARYDAVHVEPADLARYLDARRTDPFWLGCNVTMPHKAAAARLVDELTATARAIGSINLIVRHEDRLIGDNVDGRGFLQSLAPSLTARAIDTAILIGCGGAARAIAVTLARSGLALEVLARSVPRARSFLASLGLAGVEARALESGLAPQPKPVLLVNATPLGMHGFPALDLALGALPAGSLVSDLVYQPLRTPLIQAAEAAGLEARGGLGMLIEQAGLSFQAFFKVMPPRHLDAELGERLQQGLAGGSPGLVEITGGEVRPICGDEAPILRSSTPVRPVDVRLKTQPMDAARFKREMAEKAGGLLDLPEVLELLGHQTTQAVYKAAGEKRLLAVEDAGQLRFPACQFVDGAPLRGLKEVLTAAPNMSGWRMLQYLLVPEEGLAGRRPLDLLRSGAPENREIAVRFARRLDD